MTDSFRETFARVLTSSTPAGPVYPPERVAGIAWWVGFAATGPVVFWPLLAFPTTSVIARYVTFPLMLAGVAAAIAPFTTLPLIGILRICFKHVSRTRWAILLALVVANATASVLFWIFTSFVVKWIAQAMSWHG